MEGVSTFKSPKYPTTTPTPRRHHRPPGHQRAPSVCLHAAPAPQRYSFMGSLGLSTNILHDRVATSNAILSVNAPSSVLCCHRQQTSEDVNPRPGCGGVAARGRGGAGRGVLLRTCHRSLASTARPAGRPTSSQCAVMVAPSVACRFSSTTAVR